VSVFHCVVKRFDFCVRQTRAPMPAASDDFPLFYQYRADHRIGRSHAQAPSGKPERKAQEKGVRNHCGIVPADGYRRKLSRLWIRKNWRGPCARLWKGQCLANIGGNRFARPIHFSVIL
jgi:hypothetical protein